jgi:hypothetical protein
MVINVPEFGLVLIYKPKKLKKGTFSNSAFLMVCKREAVTLKTSILIRLNSSKQDQHPVLIEPIKIC